MADSRLNSGARMAIIWGLAYLILASVVGLELDWGRHFLPTLPAPKPVSAAPANYPVQPEFTLPPLEQGFAETTARPAFTSVRRPPPPPEPPKPAMRKGQFVLLGALITGDKNIALLHNVATGKAMRVEQGKEVNGITLAAVLPEKVVLTQYDDSEELVLKIQQASNHPITPNAAPKQAGQQPRQPGQPKQPGKTAPQPPADAPVIAAPEGAVEGIDPQSRINRRRAARGLPPI